MTKKETRSPSKRRGPARRPIPQDWQDERWACVQIQWPWSPEWFAILTTMLDRLQWWNEWAADTGSVEGAKAVGREIFEKNYPFNDCAGIPLPPAHTMPTAGSFGGVVGDCEDWTMPCLNIAGLLKIENGILYAKDDCCVWVEVGAIGGSVPDDLGDAPYEIPGAPTPTYSGCGKAIAVIEAIWRVGDAGLDCVNTLPLLYEGCVQAQSGININSRHALSMQLLALEFEIGWTPQVFDPQIKQDWICTLADWFEDDANGMNSDTVIAFKKHILASKWANIVDRVLASTYWMYVVDAIGKDNLNNFAKLGATNTTGDCDCPGLAVPPPFPVGQMIYDVIEGMSAVTNECDYSGHVFSAETVQGDHIEGSGSTTTNPNQQCALDTFDEPGIEVLAGDEIWFLTDVYQKGSSTSFLLELGFTQERTGGDTEYLRTLGDVAGGEDVTAVPGTWVQLGVFAGDPATLSRVYGAFHWYADGETLDLKITGLIIRRP